MFAMPGAKSKPPARFAQSGQELAYAQITANVVGIAGLNFAGSTSIVAAPATNFDGTPVWIEFYSGGSGNNTAGAQTNFTLSDGGIDVGIIGGYTAASAANNGAVYLKKKITPAPGSHTYSVTAYVTAGSGNVNAGAGTIGVQAPAFIRITKA